MSSIKQLLQQARNLIEKPENSVGFLSPWFSGYLRPAHIGYYQRRYKIYYQIDFDYWDGKQWLYWEGSNAALNQNRKWRGLAKKPS